MLALIFVLGVFFLLVAHLKVRFYSASAKRHRYCIRRGRSVLALLRNKPWYAGAALNYLRKIDPFVFEECLLDAFKAKGYRIKRNKAYTGDGGVDGRIYDADGKLYLIQAKRYSSAITPSHVSDFSKTIAANHAAGGFFIHTGRTGKKSYQHKTKAITFISGEKLLRLLSVNLNNITTKQTA